MTDLLDIHNEMNVHIHSQGEDIDRIGKQWKALLLCLLFSYCLSGLIQYGLIVELSLLNYNQLFKSVEFQTEKASNRVAKGHESTKVVCY